MLFKFAMNTVNPLKLLYQLHRQMQTFVRIEMMKKTAIQENEQSCVRIFKPAVMRTHSNRLDKGKRTPLTLACQHDGSRAY